jgi:hypothetical protein
LFNLATDPGETLDLKDEFPEVIAELEKLAEKYRKELGDDLTGHGCKERRPAASVQ